MTRRDWQLVGLVFLSAVVVVYGLALVAAEHAA